MGALTLKPSAYKTRPWELTRVSVFNYFFPEENNSLVLHLRGGKLFKVTQSGGWIRDRIRFFYDGIRRQRLIGPTRWGASLGWGTAVLTLTEKIFQGWLPRVDPGGLYFFWFLKGTSFFVDQRLPLVSLAVDANYRGVYLGSFGLTSVESSSLGLPTWLMYEEENILTPPTGGFSFLGWGTLVVQIFKKTLLSYRWVELPTPAELTSRVEQRALFQVSPLQRLFSFE